MKRIITLSTIFICSIFLCMNAFSQLILEHTFDGYYFPYNFPIYEDTDPTPYFASTSISVDGNTITLLSYNEDYTLRDNYHVSFDIPMGYKPSAIAFSPSLKMTDGTPMFAVSFTSESIPYGDKDYCIAKMYDARNGSLIDDLGSSTSSIMLLNAVYLINGKPSICVVYISYDRIESESSYITSIYSLGTPVTVVGESIAEHRLSTAPIMYYDINGNILNGPADGIPYISVSPDGNSKVYMHPAR